VDVEPVETLEEVVALVGDAVGVAGWRLAGEVVGTPEGVERGREVASSSAAAAASR